MRHNTMPLKVQKGWKCILASPQNLSFISVFPLLVIMQAFGSLDIMRIPDFIVKSLSVCLSFNGIFKRGYKNRESDLMGVDLTMVL